jgi:hypothetical protein
MASAPGVASIIHIMTEHGPAILRGHHSVTQFALRQRAAAEL